METFKTKITAQGNRYVTTPFEFINEAEKRFFKKIKELYALGVYGRALPTEFQAAALAKSFGIPKGSFAKAITQFRAEGKIPREVPGSTLDIEKLKIFRPDLVDKNGNSISKKWETLGRSERSTVRAVLEGLTPDVLALKKAQGQELKKFLDKFIEFEKLGIESRLFVGNSPARWLTKGFSESMTPSNALAQQLGFALTRGANRQEASSFQYLDEFNDPKYRRALNTINKKYVRDAAHTKTESGRLFKFTTDPYRGTLKDKYMKWLFTKELPTIMKSKAVRNAPTFEKAIEAVRAAFSDTLKYPNILMDSSLAKVPFDPFIYGRGDTKFGGPLTELSASWLTGDNGKKALRDLEKVVASQKVLKTVNPLNPQATAIIDDASREFRNAINNPRLGIFFKPVLELAGWKEHPFKGPGITSGQRGNTGQRLVAINEISKIIPPAVVHFFTQPTTTKREYVKKYEANLAKIKDLPGRFKDAPSMYAKAVNNLNKVLTAQLGGLTIQGEHRLGMGILNKSFNPNYVARMVLGPRAFNEMKSQYIEKQVTSYMNRPDVGKGGITPINKAKYYNETVAKFAKDFGLGETTTRTFPKFAVSEKGKLIETQLEKTVKRFGIDEMGNLKNTVKNALVEQAAIQKLVPRLAYKSQIGAQNIGKVSTILRAITADGPNSSKVNRMISNLVEGDFEKVVNKESQRLFGRQFCAEAIAQPLVKQFRNDDPFTYLTDPDQQAGMLEALIEGERPKPRSEILDTATTAGMVGATAAAIPGTSALWKARRQPFTRMVDGVAKTRPGMGMPRAALGPVGKFISGAYTPAGLLAHEPLRIAQMRREGESWGEIAKSPTLWMGPAFADTMTKMATAGMKGSPRLAKALSLGISRPMLKTISRKFGMPGLALSAGLSGYDLWKDYKKKRGFFARDED
jgi:hypothetical protein